MITEEKLQALIELAKTKEKRDKYRGRSTWVKRWMLLHLLIGTGLSVKEITQLRLRDVKLNCSVNYLITCKGSQVLIDEELARHIREFVEIKGVRGEPVHEDAYLMTPILDGRPYSCMGIYNLYRLTLKEAGLPQIKFKDFHMSIKK